MSEISVQFGNEINGYKVAEVDSFVKGIEAQLQERKVAINSLQEQVSILEAKLEKANSPEMVEAAKKIELYDKLMKKMGDDYANLLAPAVAKKKSLEQQAEHDYEVRMREAKTAADEIYAQAADRIAVAVDQNMDRLYDLLDDFIYSRSFPGRVEAFVKTCNSISEKIACGIVSAVKVSEKAYATASVKVQEQVEKAKVQAQKVKDQAQKVKDQAQKVKDAVDTYKQNKLAKIGENEGSESVEG